MPAPADPFAVPAYLPTTVRAVLPWARRHVTTVAARYAVSLDDLWDEAVTALLRASLHHDTPEQITRVDRYCRTAIARACWRYVVSPHVVCNGRKQRLQHPRPVFVPVEDLELEQAAASSEEEVMAREAVYARAQRTRRDC